MVQMRITVMNWALFTVHHFGATVTESRAAELRTLHGEHDMRSDNPLFGEGVYPDITAKRWDGKLWEFVQVPANWPCDEVIEIWASA